MIELNKVMIVGRLTRDPEVRHIPSGAAVGKFSVALNRRINRERSETIYVDCECWDRQAEFLQQFFSKGKAIFVEGRLKTDSWEDQQTGQRRSRLVIVAERLSFVGGRDDAGGGDGEASRDEPGGQAAPPPRRSAPARSQDYATRQQATAAEPQYEPEQGSGAHTEDDIPF